MYRISVSKSVLDNWKKNVSQSNENITLTTSKIHFADICEVDIEKDKRIVRQRGKEERETGKGWQHPETFSPSQS